MRSSASTRSRPERSIRLRILVLGDDHPRACTGRRLLRLGLASELRPSEAGRDRGVALDPYAEAPLSHADLARAASEGVLAVDCSWNRLATGPTRGRRGPWGLESATRRRLPFLLAANPQHYGRLGELNTVEALAAALYVLGRAGEGVQLLEGFAGGSAFFEVNRVRLERYAGARDAGEILAAEHALFASA